MTSSKQRRVKDRLRRCIERGVQRQADAVRTPAAPAGLLEGLRNINRSVTKALDVAGVPDKFQGVQPDDWDMNEDEGRFWK